jgi:hypothetical protein
MPGKFSVENAALFRRFRAFINHNAIGFAAIGLFWITAGLIAGTPCLINAFTGIPCPACGITRAITALLGGNVTLSFFYHPLLLACAVVLLLSFVFKNHARKLQLTLVGAILIVYVLRMVLFFPHITPMVINSNAVIPRIFHLIT